MKTSFAIFPRGSFAPGGTVLVFLDGRPSHDVYVYVRLEGCKCLLKPPISNAKVTHHGSVTVLWRPAERTPVRAALRALH